MNSLAIKDHIIDLSISNTRLLRVT